MRCINIPAVIVAMISPNTLMVDLGEPLLLFFIVFSVKILRKSLHMIHVRVVQTGSIVIRSMTLVVHYERVGSRISRHPARRVTIVSLITLHVFVRI